MLLSIMKGKLHNATVTDSTLEYEGSIAIDSELLEAAGMLAYERVDVLNITNGNRFTTYTIPAPHGSRVIGVRGAAAHLVDAGDKVIIIAYAMMTAEEAKQHRPAAIILEEANKPKITKHVLPKGALGKIMSQGKQTEKTDTVEEESAKGDKKKKKKFLN